MAAAYLLLTDGSVHTDAAAPSSGFHVTGDVEGQVFLPKGDVLGDGELATFGSPGWMELAGGVFQSDRVAREPFPPYVRGFRDDDGRFAPSTRTVQY